jgi:two-component system, cell cycle sensor histidine kinase and response regulator CckA
MKKFFKSLFGGHTDTILIAEPDPMLRQLECRALSPNYEIVSTDSAEEAVRTAARHETEIDLLLTEAQLPRVDGWELAELVKLDYPDLKVVYLSGLTDGDRLRQAVRDALEGTQNDLKHTVHTPSV